ncbi:hypothetical protein [Janthinobacterium sp. PC23-8]|uniref:hypothetical protein n=1 Tax=Janthinobacterium sp. PC23-8 TaxID=2012679 RepID=UPI000B97765A|nr:hypothetical protein [Janthinobacterium sp. PC23-8]OYO27898.1 hypothetical protein CD932_22565 [Janthinobacterium sp. PC23-8]
MGKKVTLEDKVLRAACVWRLADRADIVARAGLDAPSKARAGDRLYRETNRLRDAADEILKASKN